jgi:hypothetical protein
MKYEKLVGEVTLRDKYISANHDNFIRYLKGLFI